MKRVLVGMTLKDYHRQLLETKQLEYTEVRLHDFTFDHDRDQVLEQLEAADVLVITSGRAMPSLRGIPGDITDMPVAVVGQRTARRMVRHGFTRITAAHSCEELIARKPWKEGQKLLYLCGNLRRDVLPDHWRKQGLDFTEMEVYQTHLLNPVVDPSDYNIALVSSPSGVRSLICHNAFPKDYQFASIGPVTSAELRNNGFQNIIEPSRPSFDLVIEEIVKSGQ